MSSEPRTEPPAPTTPDVAPSDVAPIAVAEALRRQAIYAESRRAWAERVGRPYRDDSDRRPPPGELDAGPDE